MSLPLPDTALTPEGQRPIQDANTPNPLKEGRMSKLDKFFYDKMPVQWLPENYAAQNGGDTEGFVEGLRIMCTWKRFKLRVSMRALLKYCESDYGQKQLELLESCSSLQAESDHLAVNIGIHSVGSYKDKVQPKRGLNAASEARISNRGDHSSLSSLSSAPLHPQNQLADETYGTDDFDNLFLAKKKPG